MYEQKNKVASNACGSTRMKAGSFMFIRIYSRPKDPEILL